MFHMDKEVAHAHPLVGNNCNYSKVTLVPKLHLLFQVPLIIALTLIFSKHLHDMLVTKNIWQIGKFYY